jgi:hypothetical protein
MSLLQERTQESLYQYLEKMDVNVSELRYENPSFSELQEIYHNELTYKLLQLMADAAKD